MLTLLYSKKIRIEFKVMYLKYFVLSLLFEHTVYKHICLYDKQRRNIDFIFEWVRMLRNRSLTRRQNTSVIKNVQNIN